MKLNSLPRIVSPKKKALGRGIGSGKGKTSGRGSKGQKARGKVPAANVGAGLILYKKLPLRRGLNRKGGNPARSPKPILITLSQLNTFKPKSPVTAATLVEHGLVKEKELKKFEVKILAQGQLNVALKVELPVSESAKKAIEKAGGQVVG